MKKPQLPKLKIAASLAGLALLTFANSASAQLTITSQNQNGGGTNILFPATFVPTWTVPQSSSVLNGLIPTGLNGNYSQETANGTRTPNTLTVNTDLTLYNFNSQTAGTTNYVTCGGSGGARLVYTLPATTYGYNLTNIMVFGGWANNGRDQQSFAVYYSTVANPNAFTLLANVDYNPSILANTPSANLDIINDASGGLIAANVAKLEFLFAGASVNDGTASGSIVDGVENAYTGYAAITAGGSVASGIVASAISITTSNQSGAKPFTPTGWTATPNLIAGLSPSSSAGNFVQESAGGLSTLTDGTIGTSGTIGGFATCGNSGGTSLIYTLTNVVSGTDVTNITTFSGWGDGGRDGQYYTVSYSTISAPNTFIPITTVYYLPSFAGATPANKVSITRNDGSALAIGAAKIKFDFQPKNAGSFNNGYQGYSEIVVQGQDSTTPVPPALAQDTLPSYASTVIGDQVIFTAAFSNTPPVSLQWLFISGGVTNVLAGQTSSTLTLNNVQLTNSGFYQLEATFSPNPLSAAPSFSSLAQLVVNSTPTAVGNIVLNYAEQAGLGAGGGTSTNFTPTWTVNAANDLILGSLTNANAGVPGTFQGGTGNFDMNIPVYAATGPGPLSQDPAILSDGAVGNIPYWPNVGGNNTLCSCGTGGAGDTMTYTLPTASYGYDVTNITVYGGWGDSGRNEQKYEVLYSTAANPSAFISLGTFDYNPNDPANVQSATRTMLIPVSGVLAKNVFAVEINWNVTSAPKNNWEGYSEVVVQGVPSILNPVLV